MARTCGYSETSLRLAQLGRLTGTRGITEGECHLILTWFFAPSRQLIALPLTLPSPLEKVFSTSPPGCVSLPETYSTPVSSVRPFYISSVHPHVLPSSCLRWSKSKAGLLFPYMNPYRYAWSPPSCIIAPFRRWGTSDSESPIHHFITGQMRSGGAPRAPRCITAHLRSEVPSPRTRSQSTACFDLTPLPRPCIL